MSRKSIAEYVAEKRRVYAKSGDATGLTFRVTSKFLVEASGLICLGNTEPGIRRAAESVLGGFVPSRQHRFADFQLQGTLSGSAGRVEA